MSRPHLRRRAAPVLVFLATVLAAGAADAEVALTLAGGWAGIPDMDVELTRPGAARRTVDVGGDDWRTLDGRLTWWQDRPRGWGVALGVSWAGDGVELVSPPLGAPPPDRVSADAELHAVTVAALHRWGGSGATGDPLDVYLGAAAGVLVPRVEGLIGAQRYDRFEVGGPTVEALFGLETSLDDNVALVLELRGGWARLDTDLALGAHVESDFLVGRALFGLVLRERRAH